MPSAPPKTHTTQGPLYSSPLKTADGRLLPSHGAKVVSWIENNCVYGEGDWFGQRVELEPFQKRLLYRLYEFYPETGRRRYRRALFGVAKGNGKTPIGAFVGAHGLLGGDHVAPRVIISAASLKQANLVFGDLKTTVTESGTLKGLVEAYDLQILLKGKAGVAERVAAEAGTNDGARATLFIPDEVHEYLGRLARVYLIIDGAIAKRQDAFTLGLSTAGFDRDSLLYDLYDHGKAVASGEVLDDSYLFEWYEAPDNLDLEDPDQWLQAVQAANPALGSFCDLDNIRHRFETIQRAEFERYHLNRWTTAAERWIPISKWDACGGETAISDGDTCYAAIIGDARRSCTALEAVFPNGDQLHVLSQVFMPPEAGEMSASVVEEAIRDLCQRYYVPSVSFKTANFYRSAQMLTEEGYPMVEFPYQQVKKICAAAQELYDAVLSGRLRHGGDRELRQHADAAVAAESAAGWRLEPMRATQPIEGIEALSLAIYDCITDQANVGEPGVMVF